MNICAITQTKEGWTWARTPPKEAGGQAPAGFLSDYLEKSMSPSSGDLYWAFNIQFWSASRDIKQSPEKHEIKGFWARVSVVSKKGRLSCRLVRNQNLSQRISRRKKKRPL